MEFSQNPAPEPNSQQENPYIHNPERYHPVPNGISSVLADINTNNVIINTNFISHLRELATNFGMQKQIKLQPENPGPLVQAWVLNEFWQKRTAAGFRFFSPDIDMPNFKRLINAKPDGTVTVLSDERVPQTIAEFDMMTVTPAQTDNVTLFEIKGGVTDRNRGKKDPIHIALDKQHLGNKVRLVLDRWNGPILPSCVLLTLPNNYSQRSGFIQSFTARGGVIAHLPQGFSELGPQLK